MKKVIVLAVLALVLPSVALATPPTTRGKSAPKVMYVLKGTFSSYQAATSTTPFSISITVSHSNYHGRALKGDTLIFQLPSNPRITFAAGTTSIEGSKGIVKFRAPLRFAGGTDLTLALPSTAMAKTFHVVVQSGP